MSLPPASDIVFDPSRGTVIRSPEGLGYGHWVGGHKISYDVDTGIFALFYRTRVPLEQGRGGTCAVAVSEDGVAFSDVWTCTKDQLAASSIEVGHPVPAMGGWRLYISYELQGTSTWRIDVIEAPSLQLLNAQTRRTVLNPSDYGIPWIKDPVAYFRDDHWDLYAIVPGRRTEPSSDGGIKRSEPIDATVLAQSDDGLVFRQLEYVFEAPGDDSWRANKARINSIFDWGGSRLATFDGGRTFYDNYEEMAGLAQVASPSKFHVLTEAAPWVTSPHGCVRYVYGVPVDGRLYLYYEYTRVDGSHDLRVAVVNE